MSEATSVNALEFSASSVSLGRSFLIVGTDTYLIDKVLDRMKAVLRNKDNADTTIVYGDEAKCNELAEHLDAFSIFSSAKLIIIRNSEKMDKKELDVVGDYFDAPSDIQTLAIVTEKIDARVTAWKKIKANCTQVVCDPPKFSGEIRSWLAGECKAISKTMAPKAIDEFINRIELDYSSAANELNKIDLLSTGRSVITEKDVLKSLGTTRIGTLIDFYRAMGKKQSKEALESVDKMLFAEWKALQVFFQFSKFFLIIWRILLLKAAHLSDNEIISKHLMDVFQSQRREYMDFSKNYTLASLKRIFSILMDTDASFKLSEAEDNILLSMCLLKIMAA